MYYRISLQAGILYCPLDHSVRICTEKVYITCCLRPFHMLHPIFLRNLSQVFKSNVLPYFTTNRSHNTMHSHFINFYLFSIVTNYETCLLYPVWPAKRIIPIKSWSSLKHMQAILFCFSCNSGGRLLTLTASMSGMRICLPK